MSIIDIELVLLICEEILDFVHQSQMIDVLNDNNTSFIIEWRARFDVHYYQ
jgi:hypothetical protein